VKCRVKSPCLSRYGVGICVRGYPRKSQFDLESPSALTASDADDILNDDSNSFSPRYPKDDG
jgi:hypothetical protein